MHDSRVALNEEKHIASAAAAHLVHAWQLICWGDGQALASAHHEHKLHGRHHRAATCWIQHCTVWQCFFLLQACLPLCGRRACLTWYRLTPSHGSCQVSSSHNTCILEATGRMS